MNEKKGRAVMKFYITAWNREEFVVKKYFSELGIKRILVMLFGNVFLGMGVSIFKLSGLGNDAFNGMLMALSDVIGIPYAHFFAIFSICLFVVELLAGKNFIGIGTIVNTFFLGYIVTFFYTIWENMFSAPDALPVRIVIMLIGVLICSLGISMYQTPDVGVSPYDSLSLIMDKRIEKIPYFWCRMATDVVCAIICYLAGGLVGLGTLVAAFGFGPFVHFFNKHFTEKILAKKPEI